MADEPSNNLVVRWRAGDQEAAAELFHRYAGRLIALARGSLPPKVRQRVDAEDVVQSVYRTFFAEAREGRFAFERGGDLWRLLVTMTMHKLHNGLEHTAATTSGNSSRKVANRSRTPAPPGARHSSFPERSRWATFGG